MKMKAFIVYPTYRIIDNKAYVYLFGKLDNGESFLTINLFRPYFWIKKDDMEKAKKIIDEADFLTEYGKSVEFCERNINGKVGYTKIKARNFDDEPVVKIILDVPGDVPQIRKQLENENIVCYEADVRFVYRFMIDNGIKGIADIKGDFKKGNFVKRIYENPTFEEIEASKQYEPKLKILSFDIETNEDSSKLLSISLYTDDYKEVLLVYGGKEIEEYYKHNKISKHNKTAKKEYSCESFSLKNTMCFENEAVLLQFFKDKVHEIDPDIITGWNLIDFDLVVLRNKFKEHKISFVLGRADWESKLRIQQDFFRTSTADIAGRQVLDGIELLKSAFISLDDYKLNTAAQAILGKGKLITGNHKCDEIVNFYKTDPQKLVDYNLVDSELVYEILEKKRLVSLAVERSILTGMQLDRVGASIAGFDSLYMRETRKLGIVCPSSKHSDNEERIKGGYVKQSIPGIYDYILVLDFKSLYPSIMRTFNIDPYRFDNTGKKGEIIAPNKARFYKKEGILPGIIERLWLMRDKAKKRDDMIASHAIKITMNAIFGIMANPMCRFFSLDIANAITSFARYIIQETAKQVEEMEVGDVSADINTAGDSAGCNNGKSKNDFCAVKKTKYKVIYGDTDSIFVDVGAKSLEEADEEGNKIYKFINEYWEATVKDWYNLPCFLELEYEKVYKKFIMPKLRGTDVGAKKRYAGLKLTKEKVKDKKTGKENIKINEKLDFVGLEFVRRDWTDLAKEFQLEMLNRIFHNKEVAEYISTFIKDLLKGKYDNLLVYKKALRKPVSEYTKTTPPHVKAAKLLDKIDSTIIKYVMTENGPEPIQKLKSKIDYDHYIDKQLKPIADSILVFFNIKFEELVSGKKQKSLFDY
ncbi:MAG: DNA polymerase II [Candidatus Woesearchaeota archaeon]